MATASTISQQAAALAAEELAIHRRLFEIRDEEQRLKAQLTDVRARIVGGASMLEIQRRQAESAASAPAETGEAEEADQ